MEAMHDTLRGMLVSAQRDGTSFTRVAHETGVSRTTISLFVNKGYTLSDENRDILERYFAGGEAEEPEVAEQSRAAYKTGIEVYETCEYREVMGFCHRMLLRRKLGVIVGYPGSGKTLMLKQYAAKTPGARYIECWPSMKMSDMLAAIAAAAGVTVSGGNYSKTQQLISALAARDDLILLFDEAEYLKKWDVDKFEVIRKIWDNSGTPVIFCGTPVLEDILTRGGGRDNLAQLYRRKHIMKLSGISRNEVAGILRQYNITPDAAAMLIEIATDTKHGGMGNFIEMLEVCLEAVGGGRIDGGIVDGAKQYKLMY